MTLQQIENMQPDQNGIITLVIDGAERRFVKTKFISFLQKSDEPKLFTVITAKRPIERKVVKKEIRPSEKRKPGRPADPKIKTLVEDRRGKHNRRPVIAIFPDGTQTRFISCSIASKELGIYRCGVSRILTGKLQHINNIKFKYADQASSNQLTA